MASSCCTAARIQHACVVGCLQSNLMGERDGQAAPPKGGKVRVGAVWTLSESDNCRRGGGECLVEF